MRKHQDGQRAVNQFDDTQPRHTLAIGVLRAERHLASVTGHRAVAAETTLQTARAAYQRAVEGDPRGC